jgi:hypothetical protein
MNERNISASNPRIPGKDADKNSRAGVLGAHPVGIGIGAIGAVAGAAVGWHGMLRAGVESVRSLARAARAEPTPLVRQERRAHKPSARGLDLAFVLRDPRYQ